MKYKNDLTVEYVKERLDYNPETGLFTWKKRPLEHFKTKRACNLWNTKHANRKAGSFHTATGYISLKLNGIQYRAHRIAWLIFYGKWPNHQIDHDDGNKINNKIHNLNDVTQSSNARNRRLSIKNTSGCFGVNLRANGTWRASITVDRKIINLGTYKLKEDAIKAREDAEKEHNFHQNHGRIVNYGN